MAAQIDIERIRGRARELSKSLLGARFRAEVAAFVKVGGAPFWARGMAIQLQIPENKVAAELARFAEGGLLTALPVAAWDRRRLYERTPAGLSYWDVGYTLVEQAATEEGLRVDAEPGAAMNAYLDDVHGRARAARDR